MEIFTAKVLVYKMHEDEQLSYCMLVYVFILFCSLSLSVRLGFLPLDRESRQSVMLFHGLRSHRSLDRKRNGNHREQQLP